MGQPAGEPRKRGRPKGSTNRRAKDLKGLIDARYGASAAQQSAQLCMVTPRELREAGGSMAKAQVNKALDLVRHVRDAKDRLDGELRDLVRDALEELIERRPGLDAKAERALVSAFVGRVTQLGGEFGLGQALKLMTDERSALLPYTDQRQPLAVEVAGERPPAVVFMGAAPMAQAHSPDAEIVGDFRVLEPEVSQSKSHDGPQTLTLPGLEGLGPAD
ncbi:hypothetical protein [Phenylobacterium sp.]|uniref:hypothetical protein n=1 Tax=Phenylobacterium sp. TaxID=1871053 RepID=UPI002FC5D7DE